MSPTNKYFFQNLNCQELRNKFLFFLNILDYRSFLRDHCHID